MKALCWYGKQDVRIEDVPDPEIINPRDAIVEVSLTAICGSDLHMYNNLIPTMEQGDILGHEFVGEVVDTGGGVDNLNVGDRVVVPFPIACGNCHYCRRDEHALCDNSNPNAWMAEQAFGYSPAGIFGYSHMYGGYAGGQAEYVRIPFADVGPMAIPDDVTDEEAVFLADVYPTGYQAIDVADFEPGSTVAVWGCGPVGLFAMQSAYMLDAERVIAIDRVPERLALARRECGAEIIDFDDEPVLDLLDEMTGGRGPDVCIDAVGMEATSGGVTELYDKTKQTLRLETDRPNALRQAMMACGKGGTIVIPGVYGGIADKIPLGAAFSKGLSFEMGQTHVHRYLKPLLETIEEGDIDPSFAVSHRVPLVEAPAAYEMFQNKEDEVTKIVMTT